METIFYSALSASILNSLGKGLAIYLLVRLLMALSPALRPSQRFNLQYAALVLIFIGFVLSFAGEYFSQVHRYEAALAQQTQPLPASMPGASAGTFLSDGSYSRIIGLFYLTGLGVQTLIVAAGFYSLKKIKNSSLTAGKHWEERLLVLTRNLNISRKIILKTTDRVFSPFTAGFLKPVIIFPVALINRLSPGQVEAILLHELAHIRRHDYLLNIFLKIMEAVLFFNPFMWLLAREIRKEREFACDDLVLEQMDDDSTYARALLHIAEYKVADSKLGLAATGNNQLDLFNRIKRFNTMTPQINSPKPGLLAVLSIAAACLSLAWMAPADTLKSTQESPLKQLRPLTALRNDLTKIPVLPPLPPAPVLEADAALPPLPPAPPLPADTGKINDQFNSDEWKAQMEALKASTAEMKKHFESPEWKAEIEKMKISAAEMKKQMESPEWKKNMEDIKISAMAMKKQFDSPEWKKQVEDMKISSENMKKQFESPEWKKQIEDIQVNSELIKKQFDSPEWKKQLEALKQNSEIIKKQFDSPEWKNQMEAIKKASEGFKVETEKNTKTEVVKP